MKRRDVYRFPARDLLATRDPWVTDDVLGEVFGVDRKTVVRWRKEDTGFTAAMADHHACRLGMHPSEIWASWYADTPDPEARRLAHNQYVRESARKRAALKRRSDELATETTQP